MALPYRAALVDEAQDFGNEAFRLVRAIVPVGENDLFIVGDAHQRIYGHQVVLSRRGIDTRGRGRKLRINYRTPEELKLDTGTDDAQGVRSFAPRRTTREKTRTNETAVAEAVSAQIKHLLEKEHVKPDAICVVAPTHRELDLYQQYLKQVCPAIHQIEHPPCHSSCFLNPPDGQFFAERDLRFRPSVRWRWTFTFALCKNHA